MLSTSHITITLRTKQKKNHQCFTIIKKKMGQRVTKLMAVILAIIMVVVLASEVEGGRKLKGDKGIMKKDDENMDQPQNFVGGMGAILPSPNGYTFTGVGFGPNGFCTFPGGCTPTTLPTITNPPPAFRLRVPPPPHI
ncbi:hypothetical protein S245_029544 [Arachis hypogaea]